MGDKRQHVYIGRILIYIWTGNIFEIRATKNQFWSQTQRCDGYLLTRKKTVY